MNLLKRFVRNDNADFDESYDENELYVMPEDIQIPNIFAVMNEKKQFPGTDAAFGFGMATRGHGKPSDCQECGQCEDACPQKLPIRELLKQAAAELE